jgi:hypothetical protein
MYSDGMGGERKGGDHEIMTSRRTPGSVSVDESRTTARAVRGRSLSLQEECLSITFESARWERAFVAFLTQAHHLHKRNGLLFSACLALTFIARGSFPTRQSKVVLGYAVISIFGNVFWVALDKVRPDIAHQWRRPAETALAFAIHAAIMMLPPLTYGRLNFPASPLLAILVRSLYLQNPHPKLSAASFHVSLLSEVCG